MRIIHWTAGVSMRSSPSHPLHSLQHLQRPDSETELRKDVEVLGRRLQLRWEWREGKVHIPVLSVENVFHPV